MKRTALWTIARGFVVAAGGAAVTLGWLTKNESDALQNSMIELVGWVLIAAPTAYSAYRKMREGHYKEALQDILGVEKDRNIGPVTVGAAEELRKQADASKNDG